MSAKTLTSDVTALGEKESHENMIWLRQAEYRIGTREFEALDTDQAPLPGNEFIKGERCPKTDLTLWLSKEQERQ